MHITHLPPCPYLDSPIVLSVDAQTLSDQLPQQTLFLAASTWWCFSSYNYVKRIQFKEALHDWKYNTIQWQIHMY